MRVRVDTVLSATTGSPEPGLKLENNGSIKHLRALKADMDRGVKQRETHLDQETGTTLESLRPALRSTYHANPKCIIGTRVKVLADAITWVSQESATSKFLWIHGPAGVGKTCIAASSCDSLDAKNMLGAQFFCKWNNPDLRESREVIKSITYGLAKRSNHFAQLTASTLATVPDVSSLPVRELYTRLLETPILTATNLESMIGLGTRCIVVDALDECGTETTLRTLLPCLYELSQLAPQLKVIVTSRPDTSIQIFMSSVPEGLISVINLTEYDPEDDIRTFVHQQLSSAGRQQYQSDGQLVSTLVENACGVFLWTDVACRFLRDELGSWSDLTHAFMHPKVATAPSKASLDKLYTFLLSLAASRLCDHNWRIFERWLSAIVVAGLYIPSPSSDIQLFLDLDTATSNPEELLEALSPILQKVLSSDGKEVTYVVCRSFFEYITTPARSGDFCLNLAQTHSMLSAFCLRMMITELKFNMCHLETSYRRNSDVPSLEYRVRDAIHYQLGYSCQHWIDHVTAIDSTHVDSSLLGTFLSGPSLLYWIETLSLLGRLDVALSTLCKLMKWLWTQRAPILTDVYELVNDAYRLILDYYDAISESTPHLYVTALAMAPARSAIAQLSDIWLPNTLKLALQSLQHWLPCSGSPITCIALSSSQTMAASGSSDGSVNLWDAETGKVILGRRVSHSDSVLCIALCPTDRVLASGAHDGTIIIQRAVTGHSTHIPLLGHAGPVLCVCFSADGLILASGSHDKLICVWDAKTGERMYAPLSGHTGPVLSISFSPDNRSIVSASTDKTARVWNMETGELVALVGHTSWVQCVTFSPDGQYVATGGYDRLVLVWEAKTGKRVYRTRADDSGPICHVRFSRDKQRVVSCSSTGQIRIWELKPRNDSAIPRLDDSNKYLPIVYLCSGIYLASGTCVGTFRLWSGETGAPAPAPLQGHSDRVMSVAFSPNGQRVASGSFDDTVQLWDSETGASESAPLVGHSGGVWSVAFSPDGRRIVSGSGDSIVRVWDVETGSSAFAPFLGHFNTVLSVAFSPDGHRIVSGSDDKTVHLWNADTGASASVALFGHSSGVCSVAFSPGSRRVVSGSADHAMRLWDAEAGAPLSTLFVGHSDTVWSVSFSPDGRRIVSGSSDKTVRLWDAETGVPASAALVGHSGAVRSVAFSPDGRRIVSGSVDRTVQIWDAETGTRMYAPFVGHSDWVISVTFSPDGQRVVSGSQDHTIRIWAADPNAISPRLPTDTSRLSPFLQSDGWVSAPEQPRLFWLPREYRTPEIQTSARDDSLVCIGQSPNTKQGPLRARIDYSRFMHGTSWTLVAAEPN